jgi:hypothetical protein
MRGEALSRTRPGGNHRRSVEVTMTRNGLASMLLDITLGATILFAVLFVVFEMIRVAGSMQLDGIFRLDLAKCWHRRGFN